MTNENLDSIPGGVFRAQIAEMCKNDYATIHVEWGSIKVELTIRGERLKDAKSFVTSILKSVANTQEEEYESGGHMHAPPGYG